MSQQNETDLPQPSIDFGYPTPAHGKIPAFNNIEEEARFWDTHSFLDFSDDFEPVNVQWARKSTSPLSVRLDPRDRAELTVIANEVASVHPRLSGCGLRNAWKRNGKRHDISLQGKKARMAAANV